MTPHETTLDSTMLPTAIPANVRVRIVGLPDEGHPCRTDWLNTWVISRDQHIYAAEDNRIIAQAQSPFDIIILHGDCRETMAAILGAWRRLWSSKVILAVLSHSDAADHAALLHAGADAVMTLDQPPSVATAWVCAMLRRVQITPPDTDPALDPDPAPNRPGFN